MAGRLPALLTHRQGLVLLVHIEGKPSCQRQLQPGRVLSLDVRALQNGLRMVEGGGVRCSALWCVGVGAEALTRVMNGNELESMRLGSSADDR